MADQCSAYEMGSGICRNGFPVSAVCMGHKCHDCGRYSERAPACQDENINARWIDDAGKPRYMRASKEQS
ncbi:hypothetical protein CBM2629_A150452 [Cupriavidus taiwanensis]|nr:hypothetical protein CBM2629_A150452 [Cupriavidus taiwanensis]